MSERVPVGWSARIPPEEAEIAETLIDGLLLDLCRSSLANGWQVIPGTVARHITPQRVVQDGPVIAFIEVDTDPERIEIGVAGVAERLTSGATAKCYRCGAHATWTGLRWTHSDSPANHDVAPTPHHNNR